MKKTLKGVKTNSKNVGNIDKRKMSLMDQELSNAQNNDQVWFFDYVSYKYAVGWKRGLIRSEWFKPKRPRKAFYFADFRNNLPNYYFLGFKIKHLIKFCYINGCCYAGAVALSLCFDNFKICTAKLKNVEEVWSRWKGEYHGFLILEKDGVEYVVDTTFGFICSFDVYKRIFAPYEIQQFSSNEIKASEPYKFLEKYKSDASAWKFFCSKKDKQDGYKAYNLLFYPEKDDQNIHFVDKVEEFSRLCNEYVNVENPMLQEFFNNKLYKVSTLRWIQSWFKTKIDESDPTYAGVLTSGIHYPEVNLNSILDDEKDFFIKTAADKSSCETNKNTP